MTASDAIHVLAIIVPIIGTLLLATWKVSGKLSCLSSGQGKHDEAISHVDRKLTELNGATKHVAERLQEHADDCDKDRAVVNQVVEEHKRRLSSHSERLANLERE